MIYVIINGTKVEVDKAIMEKYGYKVGDLTPFTGLEIKEG